MIINASGCFCKHTLDAFDIQALFPSTLLLVPINPQSLCPSQRSLFQSWRKERIIVFLVMAQLAIGIATKGMALGVLCVCVCVCARRRLLIFPDPHWFLSSQIEATSADTLRMMRRFVANSALVHRLRLLFVLLRLLSTGRSDNIHGILPLPTILIRFFLLKSAAGEALINPGRPPLQERATLLRTNTIGPGSAAACDSPHTCKYNAQPRVAESSGKTSRLRSSYK